VAAVISAECKVKGAKCKGLREPQRVFRDALACMLRFFTLHLRKELPMKPVIRYQSRLLSRRSYKPSRVIRIRPSAKPRFVFRPVGFGSKPQIDTYEYVPD
jgi:hypothetical protein